MTSKRDVARWTAGSGSRMRTGGAIMMAFFVARDAAGAPIALPIAASLSGGPE